MGKSVDGIGAPSLVCPTTVSPSLRIFSWNVNGIRAAVRQGFTAWLRRSGADIVALQEVRAAECDLPAEITGLRSWHRHFVAAQRKGYSGVGLLSKTPPELVTTTLDEPSIDAEGRLQVARFGALWVVNSYFPNGSGKNRDNGRVPFKLDYSRRLERHLEPALRRGEPIVVVGDFNTAQEDIDLARPKQNRKTSGFLDEERDELRRWISKGWTDSFRAKFPGAEGQYTWWSQRFGVREKNIGWRIDYALVSPGARAYLRSASIHSKVIGSDHCPISIEFDAAILQGKL